VGWNKIVFPLSYQAGVTPTTLNVQDIANSTETGAAPYQFANPAWVLKWSAGGSWYKGNFHGTHNIQFGFEWGKSYNFYIYNVNQGINVQFNGGVPSKVLAFNTPTTQKNIFTTRVFYLQDTWSIKRRLTLNVGLRTTTLIPTTPRKTATQMKTFLTVSSSDVCGLGDLVDWNTVSRA